VVAEMRSLILRTSLQAALILTLFACGETVQVTRPMSASFAQTIAADVDNRSAELQYVTRISRTGAPIAARAAGLPGEFALQRKMESGQLRLDGEAARLVRDDDHTSVQIPLVDVRELKISRAGKGALTGSGIGLAAGLGLGVITAVGAAKGGCQCYPWIAIPVLGTAGALAGALVGGLFGSPKTWMFTPETSVATK
jgi:hypothetical protein